MAVKNGPWNIESLENARAGMTWRSAQRGKAIYEQGKVISCKADSAGTHYRLTVQRDGSYSCSSYRVELTYSTGVWRCSCACYGLPDCKHIYAALLHLENECKNNQTSSDPQALVRRPPAGFFALFPDGKAFSNRQRQFLEHLEYLFNRHQRGETILDRDLQAVIRGWPVAQARPAGGSSAWTRGPASRRTTRRCHSCRLAAQRRRASRATRHC
jgi:hypothetical protein